MPVNIVNRPPSMGFTNVCVKGLFVGKTSNDRGMARGNGRILDHELALCGREKRTERLGGTLVKTTSSQGIGGAVSLSWKT